MEVPDLLVWIRLILSTLIGLPFQKNKYGWTKLFLKNTQTLIGSRISTMKNSIYQIKPEINITKMATFGFSLVILTLAFLFLTVPVHAIVDPQLTPNNKFGIHIISATSDEASSAGQLVNSSGGDWGYVTFLIESKDRNHNKWQTFFDGLRRKHLIPIVRLATAPDGNFWKLPYEGEEAAWADFLDNLIWPTKNRYIVIYNEPNQGQEWGGQVDARSYARVLDKTITALKNKNPDFFVLNAGFDASAPNKLPLFMDELTFMSQMDQAVPGIFNKLDGWVSHSYPNPNFTGSPKAIGKGTVGTWYWELQALRNLEMNKILPIFITETGWKHAEGRDFDKSLPTAEIIGDYLKEAFQNAWSSDRIVAITPFLLNYQEAPFDHFSFKKLTGEGQNMKILGASYPDYYPHYQDMMDLPKSPGKPVQENKAELVGGSIYSSIVAGENYDIPLTFKNTGQSIWNDGESTQLRVEQGGKELGLLAVKLDPDKKIEPGQEAIFTVHFQAPQSGLFNVTLQLYQGEKPFDEGEYNFTTQVRPPVILVINAALNWKNNPSGKYILGINSDVLNRQMSVDLNESGASGQLEENFLLPDHYFQFNLSKPFYKQKIIQVKVDSGINKLDFGSLEPDIPSALLQPGELWKLLPFSN